MPRRGCIAAGMVGKKQPGAGREGRFRCHAFRCLGQYAQYGNLVTVFSMCWCLQEGGDAEEQSEAGAGAGDQAGAGGQAAPAAAGTVAPPPGAAPLPQAPEGS
jgi:hypothetical protein